MRKFIAKCSILILFALGMIILLLHFSTDEKFAPIINRITGSTEYAEGYNLGPSEIIPYIHKVSAKDDSTKLILGDSVCFRMFSELQEFNPHYCIAGSNRGVTMSGQYILMKLYLDNHPNATDVYLAILEDSLITTYETGYGYQYAVMPFLMTKNLDLLDEETIQQMKKTYGSFMINRKSAEFINQSAFGKKLYLNLLNKIAPVSSQYEIPDVAERYIVKMAELCKERGVNFHLLANPLSDTEERREIEPILRAAYKESAIYEYFPDYFDQIHYYAPENFSDGIHPSVDRKKMNDYIRDMQKAGGCMEDLVFE